MLQLSLTASVATALSRLARIATVEGKNLAGTILAATQPLAGSETMLYATTLMSLAAQTASLLRPAQCAGQALVFVM
jgi:hypothetical protein